MHVARYGNLASAATLVLLDEDLRRGAIRAGARCILCALGAGAQYGAILLRALRRRSPALLGSKPNGLNEFWSYTFKLACGAGLPLSRPSAFAWDWVFMAPKGSFVAPATGGVTDWRHAI